MSLPRETTLVLTRIEYNKNGISLRKKMIYFVLSKLVDVVEAKFWCNIQEMQKKALLNTHKKEV